MTQTASFFDSYARDFEAIYGNKNTPVNRVINHYFRKSMRVRYERTIAGCSPIEARSVLDIGCGPGHYSVELARRGAADVLGIDFAEGMIKLADGRARAAGVEDRCRFVLGDILEASIDRKYDYTIVMGFMDYVEEPRTVIDRILEVTSGKAFISFPVAGGVLAWQRKLRYRQRCPLYLYSEARLRDLFRPYREVRVEIEPAARDFFVTITV
jgi:2-polyprenyl-3-methyl-5-hydroxy-6-metoxy-1,4-benzoquinol methylase